MYYSHPTLPYSYNALEPVISEKQLRVHHEKHHKAYVDAANSILKELEEARKISDEVDFKAMLKNLSFQVGGHVLHSLFWTNLAPKGKTGKISKELESALKKEFGSIDRFKEEFTNTALTVEGSGWAALSYCKKTKKLMIMQIEKHNQNIYPGFKILLVVDVWEHAYYLDYQNRRAEFLIKFWSIVNWAEVSKRFKEVM